MSLKKRMLIIAAVTAVTAATAVPAMALENEFHGLYRLRAFVSNFDDSGSGAYPIGGVFNSSTNPITGGQVGAKNNGKTPPTNTYIEQRARLMYIAKANEDLRLVTHFEFDSRFGDTSYNANANNTTTNQGTTRNGGGGIGADQTNLETKNIFLEFRIPSTPVKVKAGIQGFTDNYKGIIFNNDAAGVTASSKVGNATIMGGYFRFDDATTGSTATYLNYPISTGSTTVSNASVGYMTRDFMTLGAKYNVSNSLVVGADYHLLYSDLLRHTQEKTYVNTVGANAEAKLGTATVNGFVLYQFGQLGDAGLHAHQDLSAFAGNLAAKMPIGPGTAHITALVLTGDNNTGSTGGERNDFQTIMERGATTSGHTFYESNSQILLRNIYAADKTDRAVVFDLNNNGRGIVTAFAGYDLPIGKFFMNSNVGIGAVERDNGNGNNGGVGAGSSNVLGTEINTEIGYKLYDNMTASVQAAYMFLGDFYKVSGGTPDDPYTAKIMLNYTF